MQTIRDGYVKRKKIPVHFLTFDFPNPVENKLISLGGLPKNKVVLEHKAEINGNGQVISCWNIIKKLVRMCARVVQFWEHLQNIPNRINGVKIRENKVVRAV